MQIFLLSTKESLEAYVSQCKPLFHGGIRHIFSNSTPRPSNSKYPTTLIKESPHDPYEISLNGIGYHQFNMANLLNSESTHRTVCKGSLVDLGVNGGIEDKDFHVIKKSGCHVDVLDKH